MKIRGRSRYTCVGSGTCVPRAERGPACHLLEVGSLRLLLDLGSGSLRSLARLDTDPLALRLVGLTHKHMDHVADLLPLIFALRNTPGVHPEEPLRVFGYEGLRRDLERLAAVHGRWVLDPGFDLVLDELRPGDTLELQLAGEAILVTAHAVNHTPEAIGFRIAATSTDGLPDVQIAYSGDSGVSDTLVELARGADLFVCECAFPDGHGMQGHLTPSELLPICAAARPRRVVATHLYPIWDSLGAERVWKEALERFGADVPVTPAHDGLVVELGGEAAPRGRERRTPRKADRPC